jgi:hypothetical protein
MENEDIKSLVMELESVKNLLIIQTLAMGCQQKHVATGVSESTLSRMFPKGFAKEIAKVAERLTTRSADAQ